MIEDELRGMIGDELRHPLPRSLPSRGREAMGRVRWTDWGSCLAGAGGGRDA